MAATGVAVAAEGRRVELPAAYRVANAAGAACGLGTKTLALAPAPAPAEGLKKLTGARPEARPGAEAEPLRALGHGVTADRPERCDGGPRAGSRFPASDGEVYHRISLAGVAPGDVVRWEWLSPDGSLYKSSQLVIGFRGRGCAWDGLAVGGEDLPVGRWEARVLVNQERLASAAFTLDPADGTIEAHGRLTRQILHLHFTGMIRLGFAVIRALCTGSGPVTGDVLDLMRDDLTALENALRPGNTVIRYDLNRVRAVRDRLPGMSGDAALVEVNRLFEEILGAVRDARISCDAGTSPGLPPPVWEGVTVVGYRLGVTVSLAACIACNQPLPDELVPYIRAQLAAARAELLPYADCLRGFDFGQFNAIRLGAPFSSQASHLDLTALYGNIDQAILSNDCTCDSVGATPPASTGSVRGTVRNASNGQPITGAGVSVASTSLSATTAADGTYSLEGAPAGAQTLRVSAQGFLATEVGINITAGQTLTQNISLSPVLQTGEIRITLNWTKDANRRPNDLDMHLAGPSADNSSCFHVYYNSGGSLTASPFAQLEVDNVRVSGDPPTETIRIARRTPGIYRFYVHNYGGETPDGLAQSRATVQVFGSTGLSGSFTAPAGAGTYWSVFTMDGQSGAITTVNQLGTSAPPTTPCR